MKRIIFTLTFFITALLTSQAQTQISGYLDSTPADGITAAGTPAVFTYFQGVQACRSLIHDNKTDWYLPSTQEIVLFVNATSPTGTAPGCTGDNCNWDTTYWCWTRTADIGSYGHVGGGGIGLFRHSMGGLGNTFSHSDGTTARYVRCVR